MTSELKGCLARTNVQKTHDLYSRKVVLSKGYSKKHPSCAKSFYDKDDLLRFYIDALELLYTFFEC